MNNINKEEAAGIVTRILMALKVPGNWAKVLAGALVGALGAWMGLTQTSCTSTAQSDPPGRVGINIRQGQYTITRAGRELVWNNDTHTLTWSQSQPVTDNPPVVQADLTK
ncbi:hypothetical protein [uncultured Akkermansia sp.]|uniref:hypothetical protein n=1 Tax=uncultured Akkermansia sp. TaxID=512294 RepID=UPI002051581E|nr:hypothetical protein [uncultured Akkermansia sp.]DAZ73183.1 MAG TPA: hypothetical protein [Caudoviricetes sp.]